MLCCHQFLCVYFGARVVLHWGTSIAVLQVNWFEVHQRCRQGDGVVYDYDPFYPGFQDGRKLEVEERIKEMQVKTAIVNMEILILAFIIEQQILEFSTMRLCNQPIKAHSAV